MSKPIDPATRIGHVHLKVSDLERALAFYCGVLGLELQQRYGSEAAFVSAGGYHHHIGFNDWESKGAPPPPQYTTGLELYRDRPPNEWPRTADGKIDMYTRPLDLDSLLAEAP